MLLHFLLLYFCPLRFCILLTPVSLFHGREPSCYSVSESEELLEPWTFVGLLKVCSVYICCKGERHFQVLSPSVSVYCLSFLNQTPTVHNVGQCSWYTQEVLDLYVTWVGLFVVLGFSKKSVINRYLLLWLSVSNRAVDSLLTALPEYLHIRKLKYTCLARDVVICRFRHYCIR